MVNVVTIVVATRRNVDLTPFVSAFITVCKEPVALIAPAKLKALKTVTKLLNIEMAPPRSSKRETSDDSVGRLSPVSIASLKPLTTDSPTDDAVNC